MQTIKLIVYSDIHHHEWSNGITSKDQENVEDQILAEIVSWKPDLWVFGGDRFLSRNPHDAARCRADRALKEKSATGIPGAIVVGNHDRYEKSPFSGHTMQHTKIYPQDLKNIIVLDTTLPRIIETKSGAIKVYPIPAGMLHGHKQLVDSKTLFDICLFHDTIKDSKYVNGRVVDEGCDTTAIDTPYFDLVLAGDNHHSQDLPLKYTKGKYIGAAMQHNWGDSGDTRGFWKIIISKETDTSVANIEYEFVESMAPKFIKHEFSINTEVDLIQKAAELTNTSGNIVRIVASGNSARLAGIQINNWQDKLKEITVARSLRLSFKYIEDIVQKSKTAISKDDIGAWDDYFKSVSSGYNNIEVSKLDLLAHSIISKIP